MSDTDRLRIKPGKPLKLKDIDPDFHGDLKHKEALPLLAATLDEISDLQELLYAQKQHALLIVLQGIDAAGTDGVCWHVIRAMNPQGTRVHGFKQPSPQERAHDFLWRIHQQVPGRGEVAVFNRSHYEDVLVVRVHELAPKAIWERRYDAINAFEKGLAQAGVTIVKFFLYISKEEQLERFKRRLDDPTRRWKISESDYSERALWDKYVEAYEAMLTRCSTEHAPWHVLPSNHKWFRNLAAARIILDAMKKMDMKAPEPSVDIEDIRRRYHAAQDEG